MSYEYTATLTTGASDEAWRTLVLRLRGCFPSGVSEFSEGRASLAFDSRPDARDSAWGSDVDIVLAGDRLQVAFHSASAAQRERVLAVLGEALRSCDIPAEFEES